MGHPKFGEARRRYGDHPGPFLIYCLVGGMAIRIIVNGCQQEFGPVLKLGEIMTYLAFFLMSQLILLQFLEHRYRKRDLHLIGG